MHLSPRGRISGPKGGWRNPTSILVSLFLPSIVLIGLLFSLSAFGPPAAAATVPFMPTTTPSYGPADGNEHPALQRLTVDGRSTPWTWTPDGQSVLVRRPGQITAGQQWYQLWRVPVGGDGEQLLAENAIQPAVEDGRVAYLRYVERGRWEAVVADLADGTSTLVGAARWSAPPVWVAGDPVYLRPSGRWAVNADLDRPPPVVALAAYTRAMLSFDGQLVAATDGNRLWVLGPGQPQPVAQADQVGDFAWSPVAARLAYVRSDDGPMPELWLWEAETGRSYLLAQGELEHFSAPAWSPDGQTLAFVRRPTGNGGNAQGDIWLVEAGETETDRSSLSTGDKLRRLAQTPADESAPRWSPDGRRLAFSMEGDTWIVDLDSPLLQAEMKTAAQRLVLKGPDLAGPAPTARVAPLGLTAPLTLWVLHDATRNTCRDVPDGQIDAIPFEQYVKQVVPNEVPALWPMEVVKAQAVAARTYGWRKALDRPYPAYPYTVKDSTADQYMCDRTHSRSDAAVDDTAGQYVGFAGKVIYTFYCAEAGDPTNYLMLFPNVPYLRSVNDPVSFGQTRKGHSWGMSQWGAYRWAAWHDWDYQQILNHYYTSAAVESSTAVTRPLVALTLPWPDHYVTDDRVLLRATASGSASTVGGNGVLTVTFSARLDGTWTTIYTDTEAGDGWGYVWPVASLSDTVTPSIGVQVVAYDSAGQVATSGVALVGLNRGQLTGTLGLSSALTSTDVTTLTLPLELTAVDPSPDRGPLQVSLGNGNWMWEDSVLSWSDGTRVEDALAGDGSAWHVGGGTLGVLSGTVTGSLPLEQPYRAYFVMRAPAEMETAAAELARLAVLADTSSGLELLGVRYIRGTDIEAGGGYREFAVDFPGLPDSGGLVWQIDSFGASDLWVDRIALASYPVETTSTTTWTLSPGEGPSTVTARHVDGAGNASPMLSLAVTVTDRTPPGQWRQFQCSGFTCTVQVRDAIAGLDIERAAMRISGDGGQSWSQWLPAASSGEIGSHHWETLSAGVTNTTVSTNVRLIQFRVYDRAAFPNVGHSPAYARAWAYLPVVIRAPR